MARTEGRSAGLEKAGGPLSAAQLTFSRVVKARHSTRLQHEEPSGRATNRSRATAAGHLQRAMTAKRAGVRLADSSEFSRGVLTLHHGSGSQPARNTPWWRTPNMAAPAELDRDTASSVACCLVPAPLETVVCFLRLLHGRAAHTASLELSCYLPALCRQLATVMHLSAFICAAID
jgi:hypothetical protein